MRPTWREHLYAAELATRRRLQNEFIAQRLLECAAGDQPEGLPVADRVPFECITPQLIRYWASANAPQPCFQFREYAIVEKEEFTFTRDIWEVWVWNQFHGGSTVPIAWTIVRGEPPTYRWRLVSATPGFECPTIGGYVAYQPGWNQRLYDLCHQSGAMPVWPRGWLPYRVPYLLYRDTEENRTVRFPLPSPYSDYYVRVVQKPVEIGTRRYHLVHEGPVINGVEPRFWRDYLTTISPYEPRRMILVHSRPASSGPTYVPSSLDNVALQDPLDFTVSVYVPESLLNALTGPDIARFKLPLTLTGLSATLRVGRSPDGVTYFEYNAEGGVKVELGPLTTELLANSQFIVLMSSDGISWSVVYNTTGSAAVGEVINLPVPGNKYSFVFATDEWRAEIASLWGTVGVAHRWD